MAGTDLFSLVPPLTWWLEIIPVVIFLWGMVFLVRHRSFLSQEVDQIKDLKTRIEKKGELSGQGFLSTDLQHFKSNEKHLAHQLALSAHRGRALPGTSIDALLQPIAEQLSRHLTPWRVLPNLMMLSGLIITLVGLTLTLQQLPLQEGVMTAEQLSKDLPDSLKHMGGAFVGSLIGIVLAVISSVVLAQVTRNQQLLLIALAELGHHHIAPLVLTPRMEKQVEQLHQAISESRTYFMEVVTIMRQASMEFSGHLNKGATVLQTALAELKSTSMSIGVSLQGASKDVREAAGSLSSSSHDMTLLNEEWRNAQAALRATFQETQDTINQRGTEQLEKLRDMQNGFAVTAQDIMDAVQQNSSQLSGLKDQMQQTEQAFGTSGEHLAGRINFAFDSLHDLLHDTLSRHRREMEEIQHHLSGMVGTLGETRHELSRSIDLNAALQGLGTEMRSLERTREEQLTRAVQEQANVMAEQLQLFRQQSKQDLAVIQQDFTANLQEMRSLERTREEQLTRAVQGQANVMAEQLQLFRQQSKQDLAAIQQDFAASLQGQQNWSADVLTQMIGVLGEHQRLHTEAMNGMQTLLFSDLQALKDTTAQQMGDLQQSHSAQIQGLKAESLGQIETLQNVQLSSKSQQEAFESELKRRLDQLAGQLEENTKQLHLVTKAQQEHSSRLENMKLTKNGTSEVKSDAGTVQ